MLLPCFHFQCDKWDFACSCGFSSEIKAVSFQCGHTFEHDWASLELQLKKSHFPSSWLPSQWMYMVLVCPCCEGRSCSSRHNKRSLRCQRESSNTIFQTITSVIVLRSNDLTFMIQHKKRQITRQYDTRPQFLRDWMQSFKIHRIHEEVFLIFQLVCYHIRFSLQLCNLYVGKWWQSNS